VLVKTEQVTGICC